MTDNTGIKVVATLLQKKHKNSNILTIKLKCLLGINIEKYFMSFYIE